MSGHNKWSKIKHKKAATDAQKSKIFGKLARLIAVESKKAGGDSNSPGLRLAIDKAKEVNMPKDNIDRAVAKGTSADTAALESVVYEAYGPGGCALIITGLTDSRNRTAAEVKHTLSKNGLELAAQGSALWAFEKNGDEYTAKSTVPLSESDAQKLEGVIEAFGELEDIQDVFTNAE
ncbi:YebC/PmpR family DNA-binding transcriptional regulator [Candidatus Kaiserbacteria bacterium CG10_big_fil_rev_8_21_14_0_10_49_17]|uniref:YebC/PmpR family DNA-binding transcriptional regulator n=1 Tax=Candidatus Kaiserbacteria bacterium CG10_big_fil_rev_8_21_14_0_10_49_17 TaxID=1974609 RepID=A0A2M6WDI7_9BACT|nr:MAG: YebC/PmpR family DNA-binding transcriptional regulator [Candidatus Kaiserbacteria bacterium CG10_big_fil_rev_8_21_14_0_10_49_17]